MSLRLSKNDFFLTGMNSVVVAERHPQADFPSHDHDFDELVIVWRGNGLHVWNDIPYPITCGDLFYINARDRHSYESVNELALDNVLFCRERFGLAADWSQLLPEENASQEQRYWRLSTLGMSVLRDKVDELAKECMKSEPLSVQLSEALLMQLALLLLRFRHRPDSGALPDAHQLDLLLMALRANVAENFHLETFCQQHQLNPRALRALFKQHTGMSVTHYLRQLRLCRAMSLLRYGNMTISDVAAECGFDDSNYFSVVFSRACGVSPRDYRQRFVGQSGKMSPLNSPVMTAE
ncbi:HTH-type transcriptional activator RhaR [Rahnella victoriana]|jgi:AraC family L-rhamnose operon transcriptional activator RhaR|uniref:HTH-type transcriptional activator RhaR n=1 Tax=Rahnella victoriana TaxID=1510570 RepID=A0ABS0DJY2_9GAMM|nr:HTH-type transcriptional activator RhaR [Rahnella victoriana]MBF7954190.1 HTH-type transcriptional activator RhaR [Rahnella victoriana]PBI81721.1 transcriptional regulator [Rahnella victoriana]VTQ67832.1 AraC family transcriptional regulator [Campylobacter jejuni]